MGRAGSSPEPPEEGSPVRLRYFSFRAFSFSSRWKEGDRSMTEEKGGKKLVAKSSSKRMDKSRTSSSEKRAKKTALSVRSIIIGPSSPLSPRLTSAVAKPQLLVIKSQLMRPKTAKKLIAQLRLLPATGEPIRRTSTYNSHVVPASPIHAVCLGHTDAEEDLLHFTKLHVPNTATGSKRETLDVVSTPVDKLTDLFNEMHIVDLLAAPDLGLGQPGNGSGLLAGAVPTAKTVLEGVKQITPQLMALGYATGRAILPDHNGVHPPTDRLSVITYWWGLEILLPPPTLEYLDSAQSVTGSVVNFLSALALINNGVREILPFIRYIAQYIDFEWNAIKRQDQGQGVICAATWIMPAAMVPRPWDFPPLTEPSPQNGVTQIGQFPVDAPISSPLTLDLVAEATIDGMSQRKTR
ncbi:uncharacterized protein LACBIDRAFT_313632 [Laccaria bicolor S238N-H82]|uniref:Predicted protein n=1 Tax=Laccaria bicolor (strain S238N-H82 / ATCC MYA-4686) TaxID=486041 RepID=B0D0G0_LACBS|nr:uncharacterized protein LACBIDRAFT_313632 [Laccaria bicolor S238N-H82]EDR11450.1 predicted protein [Laccaria bicolor S238N-H82]|eukprot:XP_001877347.1 predicted protein [Laccaria bicolor S238N-H82]